MPTYEYQCNKCDHRFEEFQSITAAPLRTCPECRGRVRRLISSGNGLIFKGSGFYITDYKNSGGSDSDNKNADTKKTEDKPKPKAEKSSEKSSSASESKTD